MFAALGTKMAKKKKFRILISVSDKNGLVDFVKKLSKIFSLEIISTGGTAKHLRKAGFKTKTVEEITKFPEILSGRVKTLHPFIFAAILADQKNPKHLKELKKLSIEPFSMIVVNLYPFEKTIKRKGVALEKAIENIDIGGVALLRAGAKNFQSVIVVCDPDDYPQIIKMLKKQASLFFKEKKMLAKKAFKLTKNYDRMISNFL